MECNGCMVGVGDGEGDGATMVKVMLNIMVNEMNKVDVEMSDNGIGDIDGEVNEER